VMPWYASQKLFYVTLKDAYLAITPYYFIYKPGILLYCLYLYIPAVVLTDRLFVIILKRKDEDPSPQKNTGIVMQYLLVIVAGIILCFAVFPKAQKHKLLIDYYSYLGRWEDVLTLAREKPSEDRLVQFHTNRALYHMGKLHEQMFDYPQTMGVDGLFLTRFLMPEILIPTTQLCIDMGFINEAIHWGNEAISQNENSPQILEQLIITNIIATNYQAAQLYINTLKANPFFRKTAVHYEKYINGDKISAIDALVKAKREIMPSLDFVVNRKSPQLDLIHILNSNPGNKMAYEYLEAYFLLKNDIASFVEFFPLGKSFNYEHMPRDFQEALALYVFELRRRGKDLPKLSLSKEVVSDFNNYLSVIQQHNGDLTRAKSELRRTYGNTYWFYVHYVSPVTNKQQLQAK